MSRIQEKINNNIKDGAKGSLTTDKHREVLNSFINPELISGDTVNLNNYDKTGRYYIHADPLNCQNLPFEVFPSMMAKSIENATLDVYDFVGFNAQKIVEQIMTMHYEFHGNHELFTFKRKYKNTWSDWELQNDINLKTNIEYNTGRKINGKYIYKYVHPFKGNMAVYTFRHNLNIDFYIKHDVLLMEELGKSIPVIVSDNSSGLFFIKNVEKNRIGIVTNNSSQNMLILEYTKNK